MGSESVFGTLIMVLCLLVTFKGLSDRLFYERYLFEVDAILIDKERDRLFSSGFLHVNWWHFAFNMFALLAFAWSLEIVMGIFKFGIIYTLSLVGGNLLALYIHRNHGDYRAVGASGAVSGIIFASILLFPDQDIGLLLLPISMPSWLFGSLFILISIFGIKKKWGNIGHEAHLGGAIIGMLSAIIFNPSVLIETPGLVALFLFPIVAFLVLIIRNPNVLLLDQYWGEDVQTFKNTIKGKSNKPPVSKEEELNKLLDKIRKSGIKSLSKEERDRLKKLSE